MQVYVYVLKCKDNTLYTGISKDISTRLKQHNSKQVSYTRNKLPIQLLWINKFETRKDAAKMERYIKRVGARYFLLRNFSLSV